MASSIPNTNDLYTFKRVIGQTSRVLANRPGDWGSIPGKVISKTQKNGTRCHLA